MQYEPQKVLTCPNLSRKPGVPNSNHQEPGGSIYECTALVPKDILPKYNHKEPGDSTSDRLTIVLNKMCHVRTHNNISEPCIHNTHQIDIV